MRRSAMRWAVPLLVCVLLAQAGCGRQGASVVRIRGKVFGASAAGGLLGQPNTVGVAATVTCNQKTATASSDGSYSLAVPPADAYNCTASAPPNYAPASATVPGSNRQDIVLNFGPAPMATCGWTAGASAIECAALRLRPGDLSGTVTYGESHAAATGVTVQCWLPPASPTPGASAPAGFTAKTDGAGRFTLASLNPGSYLCVGGGDMTIHTASVAPTTGGTIDFSICRYSCPTIIYHKGPVMHTFTAYLIFWLPQPYFYDATGSPSTFESIMAQYFRDIGGTPFYNLLTQYWDYAGPIQNSVSLGGTYVDTRPYGHAATAADPLSSNDMKDEVQNAIDANHWTADLNHAFFVFTGFGAQICTDISHKSCSFLVGFGTFCGYHDYIPAPAPTIYAVIPDSADCVGSPYTNTYAGPNHDRVADEIVDVVSHEQFESATDPDESGWYSDGWFSGEIGDLCESSYGPVQADGGDVTLNHGHGYRLQGEWNDRSGRCAFSL
jgi:hypothetical protein